MTGETAYADILVLLDGGVSVFYAEGSRIAPEHRGRPQVAAELDAHGGIGPAPGARKPRPRKRAAPRKKPDGGHPPPDIL